MTTNSEEILVTHLRVFRRPGDIPAFIHAEVIPDEAQNLPGRKHRKTVHEGFVFSKSRRAIFVSPYNTIRQMTCIISSNRDHPTFSGILLNFEALHGIPFAARIHVEKAQDIELDEIASSSDYGLFSLSDRRYKAYLPYIDNTVASDSVMFADSSI